MRTLRFLFFILTIIIPLVSHAQRPKTFIDEKIDSLKQSGIDSIIVYSEQYAGPRLPDNICGGIETYYLIWKSGEKVYFQKICLDLNIENAFSKPAHTENSSVYFLLYKYASAIKSESFQPFIARYEYDGKTWYQPLYAFHPTIYTLKFYWEDKDWKPLSGYEHYPNHTAQVSTFELLDKLDNSVNLNYQYNINSETYKLLRCIQVEIVSLQSNNELQIIVK